MVKVAFGPRTASFAKWLVGISQEYGMFVVRGCGHGCGHGVHPEDVDDLTMVYSYKPPSFLRRMPGSEGLAGHPILVYQPWQSIRQEVVRRQLKWKASDFCGWVRWAAKVVEPVQGMEQALDVLALSDVHDMMVLFPQKSCRKEVMCWVGTAFKESNNKPVPLGLGTRWKGFQVIILP